MFVVVDSRDMIVVSECDAWLMEAATSVSVSSLVSPGVVLQSSAADACHNISELQCFSFDDQF